MPSISRKWLSNYQADPPKPSRLARAAQKDVVFHCRRVVIRTAAVIEREVPAQAGAFNGDMAPAAGGDIGCRKGSGIAGNKYSTIGHLKNYINVCVAINTRVFACDNEAVT